MDDKDVRWTAKAPALGIGVAILVAGFALCLKRPRLFWAGLIVMALGGGFVGYSMTIKEWCAARDLPHSAFSSQFSGSFHSCLRQKGWLEF